MVDRPETRAARDDERQAERDGEVADVVLGVQRDEQAADALDDEHVGVRAGRARGLHEIAEHEPLAREVGGEMRRDGGAERPRADVAGARAGDRR